MISLPIPRKSGVSYGELKNPFNDDKFRNLGELVEQLTHYSDVRELSGASRSRLESCND